VTEQGGTRPRRLADRLLGAPAAAPAPRPPKPPAAVVRSLRWAALVVGLEALAAVAAGVYALWSLATGSVSSARDGVGIAVVALLGAAALAGCARGLWRVASWARGPVVALQLIFGLIGYTAAFQGGAPQVGVPVLAAAAVELYLLATPEARLAYANRR
jgi:hypothetical protein